MSRQIAVCVQPPTLLNIDTDPFKGTFKEFFPTDGKEDGL